ncbi:MAG: DnaJ domain-containing protein, partial [bacterium]|nr:DnaJ domain-containing protein [bacterium]
MPKNYYNILGIEKGASKDEIKKAFRKKAHQYHPDKETGDEAKFKEINEAYQVLSDEQKRAQYDQYGQTFDGAGGFPGGGAGFGGFGAGGINIDDLGDMFGDFFGGGFGGSRTRTQRGQDIQVDVSLTFKESIFGAEKEISLT